MGKTVHTKWLLALTLAVTAISAAAQTRSAPSGAIMVTVVDGTIRVSNTGLKTSASTSTLTWQLGTAGYRFNSNSIDFGSAQGYFSCVTQNYGQTIRCTKSADAPSGQMPYTITVSDGQGALQLPQPDIFIMND